MTEVLNMASENINQESGEDYDRHVHVADKLKDLAVDIDSLLPDEAFAGIYFADAMDEFGNVVTIAKTTPSTRRPLGFAYLVQRQSKPGSPHAKGRLMRYTWHPVMMDSRQDQHYFRSGSSTGEGVIEDFGFDLHDLVIIEGIIKCFKNRGRK